MTELITITDIKLFKGITSNLNTGKELVPHILEAQNFELRPWMGESFFLALLDDFNASPSLSDYSDLFNGVQYTYQGKQYSQEGLRAILVYHTYARYLSQANITSTPHGIVSKNSQYSERVSETTISRLITQARSAATVHEDRVTEYLSRHSASYPLWKCPGGSKYSGGHRIKSIG